MTKYLLLAILILIVINAWVVNFRRRKKETRDPGSLVRERALATVALDALLSTTRGLLTATRVVRDSNRWFLSRRDSQVVQLEDVHSVSWQVQLNLWLLVFGGLLIGIYSPFGILLLMYAIQTPIAAVGFQSHFLPHSVFSTIGLGVSRSHVIFRAWRRDDYPQLRQLYEAGVAAWSRIRRRGTEAEAQDATQALAAPPIIPFYAWSSMVWLSVWIVFLLAHVQRFATGHAVIDHPLFGAFYIGLPLAVTLLDGARSGLWAALVTFLMLLAVKFPAGLLFGLLLNDGQLHLAQALGILLTLVLIVALGGFIHRSRLPLPAELAILLIWPVSLLLLDPGSVYSYRTAAVVLAAAGVCRLSKIALPAIVKAKWLRSARRSAEELVDFVWGPA